MRSVVVLPAPFDPMNPNKSPLFTVRSKPYKAGMLPYIRVSPLVWTAGIAGAASLLLGCHSTLSANRHNVSCCVRRGENWKMGLIGEQLPAQATRTAPP